MIPVTKPYLPQIDKYQSYIEDIYQRQWLTNNGPLINQFELKIKEQLNLKHLLCVSNGTIALQLAIKALELSGEIITTPFSYVATTSSIVWEGCTPVYVDIDQKTLNIDPKKIEAAITDKTSAILATHCFGNACDIDAINKIAIRYKLKVIYDAAHCFGTNYKNKSIFEFGDVSTCSLHATKLVHSVEGGFISTSKPELLKRLAYMRNFGHDGPDRFNGIGINGKNSEFHAAMGLAVLDDFDLILQKRKEQSDYYTDKLNTRVQIPTIQDNCTYNFAYYPVILENEKQTISVLEALEKVKIFPRRYFYPSLNTVDYVSGTSCPVSEGISNKIICLPLYHQLSKEEQSLIIRIILRTLNYG